MVASCLDIDPKNLTFEFAGAWLVFQASKGRNFLYLWAKQQQHNLRLKLENVPKEELDKVQGALRETQNLITLLEQTNVENQLKQVLEFQEKNYGR